MHLAYNKSWMALYQGQFVPIAIVLLLSQVHQEDVGYFCINACWIYLCFVIVGETHVDHITKLFTVGVLPNATTILFSMSLP